MSTINPPATTVDIATLSFDVGGESFRAIDVAVTVAALGVNYEEMPQVIRVFAENLLRSHLLRGPAAVSAREIAALLDWQAQIGTDVPLYVSRVILPDSTGVPVLQDLAALREEIRYRGGDPALVDAALPLDVVIDHSLQVDRWGSADAMIFNMRRELERNGERYDFLRWCEAAFGGITVHPPGTGIIHQVNLERVARVVCAQRDGEAAWAFPDFVIGGDSHTPMVNALGVLGWGVGGIDAEGALLGQAYVFPIPEVVGVELVGSPPSSAFTTDVALMIAQRLRAQKVVNCAVEFTGPAVADLPIPVRATIANMAPEYGATCGYFAVDDATLDYLRATGRRAAQVALVEAYAKAVGLFGQPGAARYARMIRIDLGDACPSVAGPSKPQQRMALSEVAADFRNRLALSLAEGGFVRKSSGSATAADGQPGDGAIAIAAITSCTNTSNPEVMVAAGLVARKCVRLGVKPPPWVKTSLAPGSQAVTRYLDAAGLMEPLRALGFELIGYGCTTCGGKSGPLVPELAQRIEVDGLVAAAVLSGNRNFPGRIHKLVQANYLMAPPLVVAYAVAGRIDFDPATEPLAADAQGRPVFLRDVLPSREEITALLPLAADPAHYAKSSLRAAPEWADADQPPEAVFAWKPGSTYLVKPPFFAAPASEEPTGIEALVRPLRAARALLLLGPSLTTDHISPSGEIPADSPSGRYLIEHGVAPKDFNTYVGRRGNHHVMVRGTFANVRLRNLLTPELEGGWTLVLPERRVATIFDAANHYRAQGTGMIVLAGAEYGTGSSRDWAAKGTALLGIRAVIAQSFERIHRANLIGMGVLPLAFQPGQGWRELGLTGTEEFRLEGVERGVFKGTPIRVTAVADDRTIAFDVIAQVFTESQRRLTAAGGMARQVVADLLARSGISAASAR